MAEVAGTAIGILSLGIQVCQGIFSYYQVYKDQDQRIYDVLCEVRTLSTTLEAAHGCLAKAKLPQSITTNQVEENIIAYASAITRLEQLLSRCHRTSSATRATDQIQLVIRKVAFPFRQGTIKDLKDTVKGLQANVLLVLQTLQL